MKPILPTKLTNALGNAGLKLKKYSPEILLGVGIASGIATVALAVVGTTKLEETVNKCQTRKEVAVEVGTKKAKREAFVKNVGDFAKIYAPAAATGVVSVAATLASHGIIKKRNIALTAAYASLSDAYLAYRDRIKDKLGEDEERKIYYGAKDEKECKNCDKEVCTCQKEGAVEGFSPYAKFFDESSPRWDKDPDYNLMFLRGEEKYFNDRLNAVGHVFLNEVYDALGLEHTSAGSVVGWLKDTSKTHGNGFIDFGIYDGNSKAKRLFVNGQERSILLDFNVDGVIYNLI